MLTPGAFSPGYTNDVSMGCTYEKTFRHPTIHLRNAEGEEEGYTKTENISKKNKLSLFVRVAHKSTHFRIVSHCDLEKVV